MPADLDPPDTRERALRWIVAVLLVLGFGACLAEGADSPDDPTLPTAPGMFREYGFGEVAIRIEPAPNQLLCALLASTDQQRARGLMEVTDLGEYAGMVFRFSSDSRGAFHLRNTPMPLSIAWFDSSGTFVSASDMAPCAADAPDCPSYGASAPYRYALEVPQGRLPELGVGPGAKLVLTASRCPD